MKKSVGIICLATSLLSSLAFADDARLYYDNGAHLDFQSLGVESLTRLELQPQYLFRKNDIVSNESEFSLERARLVSEVQAFEKRVTARLSAEFSDADQHKRDDTLKDLWVEAKVADLLKVRLGQFKVPFGKQFLIDGTQLQLSSRAISTDYFSFARQAGAMAHGKEANFFYGAAITNGNSDGEGENLPGVDTKHIGSIIFGFGSADFDRSFEGLFGREDETAYSIGFSAAGGEQSVAIDESDFYLLGADAEFHYAALNFTGEYFYRRDNFVLADNLEESGFNVQVGQFIVPKLWEVASRFAMVLADGGLDQTEYSSTLTRYVKGRDVKIQLGVSFFEIDTAVGDDLSEQEFTLLATFVL